jgi:hypothetical protein
LGSERSINMHAFLTTPNGNAPTHVPALGAWIQHRRLELRLSIGRSAAMTGIKRSDWLALEAGWFPTANENLLRLLASTLQVRHDALAEAIAPLETPSAHTTA